MMNKTVLMLSVSCMSFIAGADLCYAGFNPYDTPPVLNAAMLKSHVSTHTSHLTAAHLSSLEDFDKDDLFVTLTRSLRSDLSPQGRGGKDKIKLAAACFVTDTTNCSGNEFANADSDDNNGGVPPGGDDYDLDNDKRCIEEGYTMTSCPEGYEPYNYCPYDRTYFEKCVSSCPSDYQECEEPYHGVGEACDGKYASCECTPCGAGYDYTTIPEGYVQDGGACLDCDGKTKYKIKPNPCDGFMDCGSMGGEAGAKTCLSGTTTKYDNCKPCPNKGTLTSCPAPFTCTYEECSGLWYKTGCQPGYDWDASSQTCTQQCSPNYQYTCSGTGYAGGSGTACGGKYKSCKCSSGYFWGGSRCVKENDCMKGREIGYILYSDMTRSPNLVSGKTPIGVVVCSYTNGGQAMALDSIGSKKWSSKEEYIPGMRHFTNVSEASTDVKSCKNTAVITAAGTSSTYPAAWAVHEYKTKGTKPGDWCLPAAGIMTSIQNNISNINNRFNLAGGVQIGTSSQYYYWSSSVYNSGGAWYSHFGTDYGVNSSYSGKISRLGVRPVIGFCRNDKYKYDKNTDTCILL